MLSTMRCRLSVFLLSTVLAGTSASTSKNVTFTNSVIPGSNPDPSCIFAEDLSGGTFLCVTSSFLSFPGMPIHASKDLINWRLTGHVFNRPEQYPSFGNITNQQFGVYAPTLRHHDGVFYVTTTIFGKSEFP
jgi:beta-xylosidase